jgi:hypothetical protein
MFGVSSGECVAPGGISIMRLLGVIVAWLRSVTLTRLSIGRYCEHARPTQRGAAFAS